jgi:hypothetical protein
MIGAADMAEVNSEVASHWIQMRSGAIAAMTITPCGVLERILA